MTRIDPNNIAPDILDWVEEALKKDQPPPLVRDRLKAYGYSHDVIVNAMQDHYPDDSVQMHMCRDFQSLANIKLVQSPDSFGAKKVDHTDAQIYTIDNFIDEETCNELAELCRANSRPSSTDIGMTTKRTSSTCDLFNYHGEVVSRLNNKIAETLGLNLNYSEVTQGQVYKIQQEFKKQPDWQTDDTIKTLEQQSRLSGQRTWTFTVYLNKPRRGGETEFTDLGISIAPERGKALMWNNLLPNGQRNMMTMHRGCPVEKGSKIILTKWFRQHGFGEIFI